MTEKQFAYFCAFVMLLGFLSTRVTVKTDKFEINPPEVQSELENRSD